ncbi:MAG: hypothetical protein Q9181_007025 [Wetmoreana brouardii]
MAKHARTHDISLIDYHVTDIETLGRVLNSAVTAACPKTGGNRYREVYVLLLSWADDDLGVETELTELEAVFRDVYGYRTDQWEIPSRTSHNALVLRIMQSLQDFESNDKLFVTYYGGHGYMNDDRQCVWLCNQQPGAATVQWSSIQTMLEEAECDVLVLLDCCAAGSSGGNAGKGVTEVIAACGFEAFAPGVGQHSFTSNLTEELKYLGQSKTTFTTAFLHNKVLARLKKSWIPRYANDENRERRRTPIYIHLADGGKQRCIELGSMRYSARSPVLSNPRSDPSTQSSVPSISSSNSEDVDMLGLDEVSQSSLSEGGLGPEFALPQVLISVTLEGEQLLRASDWLDWLGSFPAVARSVQIEGVYKSQSTLLHLSLPVALWDAIPNNPAISFVSFIKTHNLAKPPDYNSLRFGSGAYPYVTDWNKHEPYAPGYGPGMLSYQPARPPWEGISSIPPFPMPQPHDKDSTTSTDSAITMSYNSYEDEANLQAAHPYTLEYRPKIPHPRVGEKSPVRSAPPKPRDRLEDFEVSVDIDTGLYFCSESKSCGQKGRKGFQTIGALRRHMKEVHKLDN